MLVNIKHVIFFTEHLQLAAFDFADIDAQRKSINFIFNRIMKRKIM